ncbi:hypothetical protein AVEN_72085-1 [Araneus ventricosus]|uniref:Uncharacterized protein n=1 Tax=Araneus ventricosus TaxID=182803 RepID=A0A4Y1ZR33_ARAVE|nr:hypothetical protein AVEN_191937-1 [Araneus ventricosus]GBM46056.1 hypothetical protein AVEN_72085-1 [Araneus ventricosus]
MILTDFLPQFYQGRVCKYAAGLGISKRSVCSFSRSHGQHPCVETQFQIRRVLGLLHAKSYIGLKRLPVSVVRKCQLRCRPRHLTVVQNYEVNPQNSLRVASKRNVYVTKLISYLQFVVSCTQRRCLDKFRSFRSPHVEHACDYQVWR